MNVDPAELRTAFSENVRERFGAVDTRMLDGLLTCLTSALRRAGLSVAPVSATDPAEFESAFADGVDEGSLDLHIRASALAATRGLSPDDEAGYADCLVVAEREQSPDLGDDDDHQDGELERRYIGADLNRIAHDRLTCGGVLDRSFTDEDQYFRAIRAAARESRAAGW